MAIFEIKHGKFSPIAETSFGAEGIYERRDIQKILKESIDVLGERLMVVAEEFGEWLDSSRRIDLLCLDPDANLVVIELKRTEDGGFMELQAIRYAAMVSEMTFDQLVEGHARFKNRVQPDFESARAAILDFLSWNEASEEQFGIDVRIILVAADFGKELTTSVMWLNDRGIDIRCLRLKPYRLENGPILLDIQQLIPLPEASSFQTQIGVKRQAERQGRNAERHELRYRFWEGLLTYARDRTQIHANRSPGKDNWISGGIGRTGFSLSYVVRRFDSQVELWISLGAGQSALNKAAFHALRDQQNAIEQEFGAELDWQELSGEGSRIRYKVEGGYKSPPEEWPQLYDRLVTAMIKLDGVMRPRVHALKLKGA